MNTITAQRDRFEKRLHSAIGHFTPVEFEDLDYALTHSRDESIAA